MSRRKRNSILAVVLAGCLAMAWVDAVLAPGYFAKSGIKLLLFLVLPMCYLLLSKTSPRSLFVLGKRKPLFPFLLGAGVYLVILAAFLLLRPVFDFSAVTGALQNNVGVGKDNFIFVALYISFVNSLLEEFFFRGFAFLVLQRFAGRTVSYLFSAGSFALYHIAIMTGWFSSLFTTLLIAALFLAGIFFNRLDEKSGTIYPSWMVHMFANFAVNTVGFILFGIL